MSNKSAHRATLRATTTLTACLLAGPLFANVAIDVLGVTVIGGAGGGTYPSPWTVGGTVRVGESSTGSLSIQAGGEVITTSGYLGFTGSTGTVTITGAGSEWDDNGDLYVGDGGIGTLNVEAGGLVSNTAVYLGY